MKYSLIFLSIFLFSVFLGQAIEPQAAKKTKQAFVSYNNKPIKIEQLSIVIIYKYERLLFDDGAIEGPDG